MSYFLNGYKSASTLTDAEMSLISGGYEGECLSTIICYTLGSRQVCEHKLDPA